MLPFANFSDDKENAYFADGVHEDLLTQLALLGELKVVSRTSVAEYRDTKKKLALQYLERWGQKYWTETSVRMREMTNKVETDLKASVNVDLGKISAGAEGAQRFGSDSYGREELVAEMAAAFLSGHCGIESRTIENSASYLAGWLRVLRQDSRLVVTAAAQAQKASDYILGKTWDEAQGETGE